MFIRASGFLRFRTWGFTMYDVGMFDGIETRSWKLEVGGEAGMDLVDGSGFCVLSIVFWVLC
ncbi:hypothetical protein DMA11_23270 [Marinilabiliaceae bacterium JC017]|nr:hypothetical protein DMA11_23270 [Marinilabiliaceae bacterium JC017]